MTQYLLCKDIPRGAIVSTSQTWGIGEKEPNKLLLMAGAFGILGDEVEITINGHDHTAFELHTNLRKAYVLADHEYVQIIPDEDIIDDQILEIAKKYRADRDGVRRLYLVMRIRYGNKSHYSFAEAVLKALTFQRFKAEPEYAIDTEGFHTDVCLSLNFTVGPMSMAEATQLRMALPVTSDTFRITEVDA